MEGVPKLCISTVNLIICKTDSHLVKQLKFKQQQYPYYPGSSMYGYYPPATTTAAAASMHQYPYGYSSSNRNMNGSGGYQHGVTAGTNNSALSQSAGHQGPGLITAASASGIGQYQHYPPYYPNPVDPVNNYHYQHPGSYYPAANSYPPAAEQILQPTLLAPTSVPPAPTCCSGSRSSFTRHRAAKSHRRWTSRYSNLELLTLLDLSVPMAPISLVSAITALSIL
ncbi:hypothetical protein DAPPUDRAFT_265463 [Daphnia pulex]|uniref:Uncharacterized protein n=1 Tax=Daphnia pulex TaxID=6669 RepID=E9HTH9_DAPPU|nr:hypothetical protein DAPPUDRAFT_265463 [Daphnia pulex]|eukprot:EFX64956.1 hypothetical protein DAPPUDRAFT_265463 [Daphnia pulex]